MKNYISIILAVILLNFSTNNYKGFPIIPPIQNQIADTNITALDHFPPPDSVDGRCIKKMNQMEFSAIDNGGKWHYHPLQSTCSLYYNLRHH